MVDRHAFDPGFDEGAESAAHDAHQPSESLAMVVRVLIARHLGIELDRVDDAAVFRRDLGADSLDAFELAMAFEETFGIEIPDADVALMIRVGDAIAYLQAHEGQRPAAGYRAH